MDLRSQRYYLQTGTALYQAFIGQITSPICPHCVIGDQTAKHLLLFSVVNKDLTIKAKDLAQMHDFQGYFSRTLQDLKL